MDSGATERGMAGAGLGTAGAAGAGGGGGAACACGAAGSGCRGPERICPGRGAACGGGGAGRAGIGAVRIGGWMAALLPALASGGRNGATLGRGASSETAGAAPPLASGWSASTGVGAGAVLAACTVFSGAGRAGAGVTCSSSAGGSSSATAVAVGTIDAPPPLAATRLRTNSATDSSIELECVFFSVTPSSGSISRSVWDGISSCRASSLIRILLIVTATAL